MPQNKGKLYTSTFKKFLNAGLGVDYSVDDIQQGIVPNEVKLQITPKMIVDYFHMASYGHINPPKQMTFRHWRGATHYCIGRRQLVIYDDGKFGMGWDLDKRKPN